MARWAFHRIDAIQGDFLDIHISDREFELIQAWVRSKSGIYLSPVKKALICSRLGKRLRHHGFRTFLEYHTHLVGPNCGDEARIAIDLVTTNETYFFREPKHFDVLVQNVLPLASRDGVFRVWSAAASSGEEAYSIAMTLEHKRGGAPWEIVGTDISTRVLETARTGLYPLSRAEKIPLDYLKSYCLKGTGAQQGNFMIDRSLREHVSFRHANLCEELPDLGRFDVIFLRNMLIYFDVPTKKKIVESVVNHLKPGGWLFIGHSETLHGITDCVALEQATIYRKASV